MSRKTRWQLSSWHCRNLKHARCRGEWRTSRANWHRCLCACHWAENGAVVRYQLGPQGERRLVRN